MTEPLLRTEGLAKHFKIGNTLSRRLTLHAPMQQAFEPSPRRCVRGEAQPRRQRRAQPAFELAQSIGGHSTECGTDAEGSAAGPKAVTCCSSEDGSVVRRSRRPQANPSSIFAHYCGAAKLLDLGAQQVL